MSPSELLRANNYTHWNWRCINIYISPPTYENFNSLISQLPRTLLLLDDFNAHSATWGASKSNNRGKLIDKLLQENYNLFLLNSGQLTDSTISMEPLQQSSSA